MNEHQGTSEPPDEPYLRSEPSLLSPASPKPLQFPQPTNIPVLENMMDIGFNQMEAHMNDPAMHNTDLRPDVWRDPNEQQPVNASNAHAHASPFSTGGDANRDANRDAMEVEQDQMQADLAAPNSNENRLEVQAAQTSNGISYQATSDLPARVVPVAPEHPVKTDSVSLPSSHPSVPAADNSPSHAAPATAEVAQAQPHDEVAQEQPEHDQQQHPIDVQSLLDTLQTSIAPAPQANVAPTAEGITVATTLSPSSQSQAQVPIPGTDSLSPSANLGTSPNGLPARPPPQDQPLINANYVHSRHIHDYHPHAAHPAVQTRVRPISSSNGEPSAVAAAGSNALRAPGGPASSNASATISPGAARRPTASITPIESRREYKLAAGEEPSTDDKQWEPDIQKKFDRFIEEERRYVNEGNWDQFPYGSRLFVGNLSSEKVTKRDIFHVFHSYGELAQIAIKQAFGFVQFLTVEDCKRAMAEEQGRKIRDKYINLEVSRPQKNTKPAQQQNNRRSRSPEYGGRNNLDRYRGGNDRGGDGHRRGYRSPSPRGYRDRDRGRYEDRYRVRSRSPPGYLRYPTPRTEPDDNLPLPRRNPRDVPEVQIIATGGLDADLRAWVEKAFTDKGIRANTLILGPHLSEEAVVKRQIVEGVLAVSKLKLANQYASQINLTIFKRHPSTRDVSYEEYDNLDPATGAQLVLREKATLGGNPAFPGQYGATPQHSAPPYGAPRYGAPQHTGPQYGYQQQQQPQQQQQQHTAQPPAPVPPQGYPPGYPPGYGQPPAPAAASYGLPPPPAVPYSAPRTLQTNFDPSNLQNLLSTLNQASPHAPQSAGANPHGHLPSGYPPQPGHQYAGPPPPQHQQHQQQQQHDPYAAYRNNPAMSSMLPLGGQTVAPVQPPPSAAPPAGRPPVPPNMKILLDRLGDYQK